eukprot:scaffold30643_cov35-Tisochrysis_lutea.AAC.4
MVCTRVPFGKRTAAAPLRKPESESRRKAEAHEAVTCAGERAWAHKDTCTGELYALMLQRCQRPGAHSRDGVGRHRALVLPLTDVNVHFLGWGQH